MNGRMHEVGTARAVRAFHVMPGAPGPEGVLHAHDYRIEVVVERAELDGRGMVCDLDVLDAALERTVAEVDGVDLERIRPADAEAVTVEVFAVWVHGRIEAALRADGTVDATLGVRVWENTDAFGGYRSPF